MHISILISKKRGLHADKFVDKLFIFIVFLFSFLLLRLEA